jgi:hypothetical protein
MKQQQQEQRPRLIPLVEWNRFHVWPPQGGLRHLVTHKARNGFTLAFVKCGRRVLVDEARFFECVAAKQEREGRDYG